MVQDYIPEVVIKKIEGYKLEGKYDEAMQVVNQILQKNPKNQGALLQIADIHYRKGDVQKAEKAVDFLNSYSENRDPMGLYIKGILEMDKNNWKDSRVYFKKAYEITEGKNHEILRCYGLSEYWYGNREKGIDLLKDAFALYKKDPELICNLVQIYILEKKYKQAEKLIKYYYTHHDDLELVDNSRDYYEQKIAMFEEFIKITDDFTS